MAAMGARRESATLLSDVGDEGDDDRFGIVATSKPAHQRPVAEITRAVWKEQEREIARI
jgi:hypothetical protein